MKVRIRPGLYVEVSPELLAKAEKAYALFAPSAEQMAAAVKLGRKSRGKTLLFGRRASKKLRESPGTQNQA